MSTWNTQWLPRPKGMLKTLLTFSPKPYSVDICRHKSLNSFVLGKMDFGEAQELHFRYLEKLEFNIAVEDLGLFSGAVTNQFEVSFLTKVTTKH